MISIYLFFNSKGQIKRTNEKWHTQMNYPSNAMSHLFYFQKKRDDKLIAVFHILSFQSTVVNTMILMISNWLILILSILIINNSINQIFWKHLQVVENKIRQKLFWLFGPRKDNKAQCQTKSVTIKTQLSLRWFQRSLQSNQNQDVLFLWSEIISRK